MSNDLRRERQPLLDALASAGADVSRPGKIKCPFHDDRHASGDVYEKGGVHRFKCHSCGAGGDVFDIRAKVSGRSVADELREANGNGQAPAHRPKPAKAKTPDTKTGRTHPSIAAALESAAATIGGELVKTWEYQRPDATPFASVGRINLPDGSKKFRPAHETKDGARLSDPPGPELWPVYRAPELVRDLAEKGLAVIVEGERCADVGRENNLPATTSAHGSGAADKTDWTPLAGKHAIILPDADAPGTKYARDVAKILARLDPPCRAKIVELPGLPIGGDIVEYIEAGGTAEQIGELADKTDWLDPSDLIGGPMILRASSVIVRPVQWLKPNQIPLGKLICLYGNPGCGKSFWSCDCGARITTGAEWPDLPYTFAPLGNVIYLSAEDAPEDTLVPRLAKAGADLDRIFILQGKKLPDESGRMLRREITLEDVATARDAIRKIGNVKAIFIDPVSAYMGGADSHNNAETRGALRPWSELAAEDGTAIFAITHVTKGGGNSALLRAMGSIAFVAAARAAYVFCKDANDQSRRLVLPTKNNLGDDKTGWAFSIVDGAVVWEPAPILTTADEAMAALAESAVEGHQSEREAAAEWLSDFLASGPKPAKECEAEGVAATFAKKTIRLARESLGIRPMKERFGGGVWLWDLPKNRRCPIAPTANTEGQVSQDRRLSGNSSENADSGASGASTAPEDAPGFTLDTFGEKGEQ